MSEFSANFPEDSTVEILGRLVARNGSGVYTGQRGEGRFLQQADVSSITAKVYNLDVSETTVDTDLGSLTIANVILDTVDDSGEIWTPDDIGYNFRHQIADTVFVSPGSTYRVEYKVTLVGGEVTHGAWVGPANPKVSQS